MTPHPEEESLLSKIAFIGILLVLLLIVGACVYVIYGFVSHGDPSPTPEPTPSDTPTPTPTKTPTPTRTSITGTPPPDTGDYQQDTQVTSDIGGDIEFYYPGVWDRYIVYDMYDGSTNYTKLYDTVSRQTRTIDSGVVFSLGAISNGEVTLFYPYDGNKVYLYDIKTGNKALSCTDDNRRRNSITLFGTMLAYYQDVGYKDSSGNWLSNYAIYVFNTVDGTASAVIDNIPKPLDMRIYGNRLVYTVVNGQGSDVYLLDLTALKPKPQKISTGTGNNNHARIYDHIIVYHSDANSEDHKDHIYIYDINTGKTISPPGTSGSMQWSADIYGNTVVYDDNRNGNWDIYAYDLSTNTERRITNEPHDQQAPVIYGNRIAYTDDRYGYQAIYTMTI